MATPLRIAVLGYGLAGRLFHCPFISAVPGLELTAIMQRHGDEASQAYPNARILRSPEEAIKDRTIDAIVVATPNGTHFDLASQALKAGKHVVVDKPMASNAQAARALIDLAKKHDRLLAPFHNRRWDADFLTLRKLLSEGALGRVVEIVSRIDRYRPLLRAGSWKEVGGPTTGLLFDLGPHLVDQALALFGPPARITARLHHDRDSTQIDDAFDIVLDYDMAYGHAFRYLCHATLLSADPAPRFLVRGTRGTFRKTGIDPQEPVMASTGRRPPVLNTSKDTSEGSPDLWLAEAESDWGTLTLASDLGQPANLTHTPYPSLPGDYRPFYANFRDAVHGKCSLAVSAEDGFRTMRLLDLARQSSAQHATLPVTWD